jgi:hypothetical protein
MLIGPNVFLFSFAPHTNLSRRTWLTRITSIIQHLILIKKVPQSMPIYAL